LLRRELEEVELPMMYHYNRNKERAKRKSLRNNPTEAERKLWQYLKGKQLLGVKLRRQYSVDTYILDFYAPKLKLAIEVDGATHFTTPEEKYYDENRTKYLKGFGIKILRFSNEDVYENIYGILQGIEQKIREMSNK
jgi:very-short-patch-repair endonuclease